MRRALSAFLLAFALWPALAAAQVDAGAGDAGAADAGAPDAGVSTCADPAIISAAAEADLRLRLSGDCKADDLGLLTAALKAFDGCAGKVKPAERWVFPVANVTVGESMGGSGGSGFIKNPGIRCYASPWAGHPAHDLFVDDPHQRSRDARGHPFPALAIEAGYVLVARGGWQPGDEGKGGNYVMLYLPSRKQIAYYAHLDSLRVKGGDRVEAGQPVGNIGRTGKNAWPSRSQTHLHFGLWDAATYRPVNSYAMLRAAKLVKLVEPEPEPANTPR